MLATVCKRSCRSVQVLVSIFNYTLGKQQTISEANTNHHTPDHHLSAVCLPFFLDEEQHKTPAYLQGIIKAVPTLTILVRLCIIKIGHRV